MYDTPRAALVELTDDTLFERVAVQVLRLRFPELRLTGPSGDLGRDAFGRRLFGARDEIVLMASCEERWTSKLARELKDYEAVAPRKRPKKAIFVTTRSTRSRDQERYKILARDSYGIALEVVDLNELDLELRSDALHHVAEFDLGVRPRVPRTLQPPAAFLETLARSIPGITAPLVGRSSEGGALRAALDPTVAGSPRVVVVEGPGGVGKTRLAVEIAHATSTTLVARSATALPPGVFADVPLDDPSIVLVDDAHNARDLSGVASMVGDPRFTRVRVVLTIRTGLTDTVLRDAGLADEPCVVVRVECLDREEIARIVSDAGIQDESFQHDVVELAQGSPLIAHAACEAAITRGRFGWHDASDLLRHRIADRLLPVGAEHDHHRATAVALALLTTAERGEDIARLAGAITGLPAQPHLLDTALSNLADAGLVDGPPYSLRPDAIAPVIVADALDPSARVRIDVQRVLTALGRISTWSSAGEDEKHGTGLLGVGPLRSGPRALTGGIDGSRLAARLAILVQAAVDRDDRTTLAMVSRAVLELLPSRPDHDNWEVVLKIAQRVAPGDLRLLDELRERLIRHWPPAPTVDIWGEPDAARRYRFGTERLCQAAASVGQSVGVRDPASATHWLLDVAWLIEPVLAGRGLDTVLRPIDTLVGAGPDVHRTSVDAIFEQRAGVLDEIARWSADRAVAAPVGLAQHEVTARGPAVTARVVLRAVRALLTPAIETARFGSASAADVVVIQNGVLPDDPRLGAILDAAVALVARLLEVPGVQEDGRDILRTIVRLPWELRAIGARGLPRQDGPLPPYATTALDRAANTIATAIANAWDTLPLAVRRSAADAVVHPTDNRPATLTELAALGDPIAAVAQADPELSALLIVQPISERIGSLASGGQDWAALEEQHRERAEELAQQLSLGEAITLLEQIDEQDAVAHGLGAATAFAVAAGRRADVEQTERALERLGEAPLPSETALLKGLLDAHPKTVIAWLTADVKDDWSPRQAQLALAVADDLPPEVEVLILDAVTAAATDVSSASSPRTGLTAGILDLAGHVARSAMSSAPVRRLPLPRVLGGAVRDVARRVDPRQLLAGRRTHVADDSRPALTWSEVTRQLTYHLARCRRTEEERLRRLSDLGLHGHATVVPDALAMVAHVLDHHGGSRRNVQSTPDESLLSPLVQVAARRLDLSDQFPGDFADESAYGAAALAANAPTLMGDMLAARLLASSHNPRRVVPLGWETPFHELSADQRGQLAIAFQTRIDAARSTNGALDELVEHEAITALTALGAGSDEWADLARRWAGGSAHDRARAAALLKDSWRQPVWAELVPKLIAAGLDRAATDALLYGIEPHSFGPDLEDRAMLRLDVLEPLLTHKRANVRAFAIEAKRRVDAAVAEYAADAARRRRGY